LSCESTDAHPVMVRQDHRARPLVCMTCGNGIAEPLVCWQCHAPLCQDCSEKPHVRGMLPLGVDGNPTKFETCARPVA
jgi:hypothetical protein